MRRSLSIVAAVLLLAASSPTTTVAAVPDYQRVITSRHADAALASIDGCILTEVFVSGMDAAFGGRPGPVEWQGLASIGVRQSDVCAGGTSLGQLGAFGAGGGTGTIVFDGLSQTLDPLATTVHFDRAWLRVSMPMTNEASTASEEVTVSVDLEWTLVGELARDTGHLHVRAPGEGNVNSHQNTLMGDATVTGTVVIGEQDFAFHAVEGAHLQEVRYGCQVIAHPSAGDPDLSC
jgi:hypothetical protein